MLDNKPKEIKPRRKLLNLEPITLSMPIGIGNDMISEVIPSPLTIASMKKYEIKELSDEYINSIDGMSKICMALLPNIADEYKQQLTLTDMILILERFGDFMNQGQ